MSTDTKHLYTSTDILLYNKQNTKSNTSSDSSWASQLSFESRGANKKVVRFSDWSARTKATRTHLPCVVLLPWSTGLQQSVIFCAILQKSYRKWLCDVLARCQVLSSLARWMQHLLKIVALFKCVFKQSFSVRVCFCRFRLNN